MDEVIRIGFFGIFFEFLENLYLEKKKIIKKFKNNKFFGIVRGWVWYFG